MRTVTVSAPARLHLGFVGLFGQTAKDFGAIGLAIDSPAVRVEVSSSDRWSFSGAVSEKVKRYVETLAQNLLLETPMRVNVSKQIPSHIGLGSGTQLALAIAVACCTVANRNLSIEKLSGLLGRGRRSGIGTAAFSVGGFLIDRNPKDPVEARTISMRVEFPQEWHILLVFDDALRGAHGVVETDAFRELGGFSPDLARQLQVELIDQIVPALKRRDIEGFGLGITKIQHQVGDFFGSIQGGRYLSSDVSKILDNAVDLGAPGVGQSSWGPTGFVLTKSEEEARKLRSMLLAGKVIDNIRIDIVKPRNAGAQITVTE